MIGVPQLAGFLASAVSQPSYQVPVSLPVPPGTVVTVYAGASGSTSATAVTDSQGSVYGLAASSTSQEWLQAYTGTCAAGLNPLASDYWTVTFATANTQNKNILAVTAPGCGVPDVATQADGNSAAPSVSGSAANGNELLLCCVQCASAGGDPSFTGLFGVGVQAGSQVTSVAYGPVARSGAVTAAASIASAPWAALLLTFPAALPEALGNQSSPSGGAQLPPYPGLPAPRTWSQGDMLLTPWLRADPGNALTLLANPPLVIAGQTTTTQSIPNATVTTLAIDTELTDAWLSHTIPARQVFPPLEGWYLAEGHAFVNDTTTGTVCTVGVQAVDNGTAYSSDGAKVANNGSNFPIPVVADLVEVNPATDDSIALYVWQNSGAPAPIASAWLKTEWVCGPSGTVISNPVPAGGWTTGGTTLLQSVTQGDTAVLVEDPTGIVTGGTIALDAANAAQESVTVTSAAGQTIGISACAYPHPASAPVAVPVSAAWMNQQVRDKIRFLSFRPIARLSSQGQAQGIPTQSWPAGTPIDFADPGTSGYRDVDNWSGFVGPAEYAFPVPGTYLVYGQVYLGDASVPVLVSAGLSVDGGTTMWGDRTLSAGDTSDGVCATVRRTLRVSDGQTVQLIGSQGSGGNLNVLATAATHSRLVIIFRGF
jgi:hypothetical protein